MTRLITNRLDKLESMKKRRCVTWASIRNVKNGGGYEICVDTWDGAFGSGRTPQGEAHNYHETHDTYDAAMTRIHTIAAKYPASGDFILLDLLRK